MSKWTWAGKSRLQGEAKWKNIHRELMSIVKVLKDLAQDEITWEKTVETRMKRTSPEPLTVRVTAQMY